MNTISLPPPSQSKQTKNIGCGEEFNQSFFKDQICSSCDGLNSTEALLQNPNNISNVKIVS